MARLIGITAAFAASLARTPGRLAGFYAASFLVIGVQLPFWPVWLAGRGLDAPQIATLFAAAIWAKVLAAPIIGILADRLRARRGMMVALAATACVGYAALFPAGSFAALLCLNLLAGVAQSALMPLGDSITLAAVRGGVDYGRVRVWGSITFILAAAGSGALLGGDAATAGSGNLVLVMVLAASAVLMLACIAMPAAPVPRGTGGSWAALGHFAASRRFGLFVVSGAALQSSHQLYYGFGTLYWRRLGFSDTVIGMLWAEGVLAEILLFWCSGRLVNRFGPLGLMALGGGAGIVRWSLTGLLPGLAAAALLQPLHALTFGASYLGAMHFMARAVPPSAAASAQTLYAAASAGLGSGLVMLAAGTLYAAYGGRAYLVMALLSALGLAGILRLARTTR